CLISVQIFNYNKNIPKIELSLTNMLTMEILGEYFTIGNLLLTLLLIFVVGFLIKYCWKRRRIYYYSAKIEGPFGLPFLGTIHPFLKGKDAHFTKTMELVEK
ncbi:unnamed protein product, partial [Tenebrio molitor]